MMPNPRFEWINWNASCLTARFAVRQTISAREAAWKAKSADEKSVRQPPHPRRRQSPYVRTSHTRAIGGRRAMGEGVHASARGGRSEVAR